MDANLIAEAKKIYLKYIEAPQPENNSTELNISATTKNQVAKNLVRFQSAENCELFQPVDEVGTVVNCNFIMLTKCDL